MKYNQGLGAISGAAAQHCRYQRRTLLNERIKVMTSVSWL